MNIYHSFINLNRFMVIWNNLALILPINDIRCKRKRNIVSRYLSALRLEYLSEGQKTDPSPSKVFADARRQVPVNFSNISCIRIG